MNNIPNKSPVKFLNIFQYTKVQYQTDSFLAVQIIKCALILSIVFPGSLVLRMDAWWRKIGSVRVKRNSAATRFVCLGYLENVDRLPLLHPFYESGCLKMGSKNLNSRACRWLWRTVEWPRWSQTNGWSRYASGNASAPIWHQEKWQTCHSGFVDFASNLAAWKLCFSLSLQQEKAGWRWTKLWPTEGYELHSPSTVKKVRIQPWKLKKIKAEE